MSSETIDRDRLSVLAGAILLALALGRIIDLPTQPLYSSTFFGSALAINVSAVTVVALLAMILFIIAAETLVRSHPRARSGQLDSSLVFWLLPGLMGLVLAAWLARLENVGVWTIALLAAAIPIPLVLAAEYRAVHPAYRRNGWLNWLHTVLLFLVALGAFTMIYDARLRSLISGTIIVIISFLLGYRLFWPRMTQGRPAPAYAAVVAFLMGQLVWILNYWQLSGLRGGLLLLLFFYVLTGVLQQALTGRFNRQLVLEYGAITLIALIGIFLLT